jgi:hypothetical protein
MAQLSTQPRVAPPAADPPRPLSARRVPHLATLVTGAGLIAVSTAIVAWARTRPGFDPYGWLVWGHQTLSGGLDTNAAPSWKPLPYLFTVPYALVGHDQLYLWMITAVAVSLAGSIFAARIAHRLTAAPGGRRWAGYVAGAVAALAVLETQDYSHYILSSQSDPMIVALCLGAIDAHLSGRPRLAFVLGVLAGLGRPEVWPFLALDGLWLWLRVPRSRALVAAGALATLALWFGIPALTSRTPFVAASNALGSGRRLHSNLVFGTIGRFLGMHEVALELAALLSVALAVRRRDRTTLALAAGVCIWVAIEIAFALHGWPGLVRYMFEAGGVMVVVGAIGVGRVLADPPRVTSAAGLAGLLAAAAVVAGLIPGVVSRVRVERADLREQHARTAEINRLATDIQRLGGRARVLACGEPLVLLEYQTVLAWNLHVNVSKIGWKLPPALAAGRPLVVFTPRPQGWVVQAVHQRTSACRALPVASAS